MNELEIYLSGDYRKEKEQKESVKDLISETTQVLLKNFNSEYGWGYSIDESPTELSSSTSSMIAFSLMILCGCKYDLMCDEFGINYFEKYNLGNANDVIEKAIILIKDKFINENVFKSKTYGENDPLTLYWCKYLHDTEGVFLNDRKELRSTNFNDLCVTIIKEIFKTFYSNRQALRYSDLNQKKNICKIEQDHIFPLLKIVQLYSSLNKQNKITISEKEIFCIKDYLNKKLHLHLSLACIEDSDFDAAELVFALEGLLLLDNDRYNFSQTLLNRVFDVIKMRQTISLYWRPLKPFVINENGLALLPLSVEIALSLLRCCRLLGKRGEDLFSKNFEVFDKYTNWIKTRVNFSDKGRGWCSEHVFRSNTVHPWETSQVLIYLVNFNDMLQRHIASRLRKYANFSIKLPKEKEDFDWSANEPVKEYKSYARIEKCYLQNGAKDYSMLLYGPPGTGKTFIAEKIANIKQWPLITITPSDFIASGIDKVEEKAKNIFKALEEQKDVVILFDEIDHLILDRDSDLYREQSQMFQFMTPSMLVKIKDLRDKENSIFIIATNYEHRIDKAIKRTGRIDNKILVLPPDYQSRYAEIKKYLKDNDCQDDKLFDMIAKRTVLFTLVELKDLLKRRFSNTKQIDLNQIKRDFENETFHPSIILKNSKEFVKDKKDAENKENKEDNINIEEYLMLFYLKAEVNHINEFEKEYLLKKYNTGAGESAIKSFCKEHITITSVNNDIIIDTIYAAVNRG